MISLLTRVCLTVAMLLIVGMDHLYAVAAPAPIVTSIAPIGGPLAGGTPVTINGSSFQAGAMVAFGATTVTPSSVTAGVISCLAPLATASGAVPVVVTNPDTQASNATITYTYAPAPAVTSVAPIGGPLAGGNTVTINGSSFQAGATVTFGATTVTPSSVTAGVISCLAPLATASGAVPVVVTNPDTQASNATITYTYAPAPAVTSVAPIGGPLAGGNTVTINGSSFQAGATVTFGATTVTPSSVTAGVISCLAPLATASGAVPVVVTNPDTQASNATITYTYAPAPAVTSVAPIGGPLAGGNTVTINGSSFQAGATVTFGATTVTPSSVTAGVISCLAPLATASGAVPVVVTNPDTQASNATITYTYEAGPAISSVSPGIGPTAGGTAITISGSSFLSGATVTVGGTAATSVVITATSISCTTPSSGAAGPATVLVTNPDTQSASGSFIYQGNGPTITAVNPGLAPASGGTALTITGSGFLGSSVTIGGAPATAVVVVSATTITCVSPAGAPGPANVVVTNSDLTSAQTGPGSTAFIFQGPLPTITLFTPAWGPPGTLVTINGTNFDPSAQVQFDRSAAGNVVVVDAQTVTCVVPDIVSGWATVTVTNPDFTSAISVAGFNVVNDNVVHAHQCGGHGFSTLLLLTPFIAWRLMLSTRSRRRRSSGAPPERGGDLPPA